MEAIFDQIRAAAALGRGAGKIRTRRIDAHRSLSAAAIAGIVALAAALGLSVAVAPPLATAGLVAMLAGIPLVLYRPQAGLLAVLALTYGMLPLAIVPGSLSKSVYHLATIALLGGLVALCTVRLFFVSHNDPRVRELARPWLPFLVLWGTLFVLGFVQGYLIREWPNALSEGKWHLAWFVLIVALSAETAREGSLHRLLVGIAVFASLEILVQTVLAQPLLYQWFDTGNYGGESSNRKRGVINGAELLLLYTAFHSVAKLASPTLTLGSRIGTALLLLAALAGVMATYTRSLYGAFLLGLLLVFLFSRNKLRLGAGLLAIGIAAGGSIAALYAAGEPVTASFVDRALSVKDERGSDARTSIGWRVDEQRQVMQAIRQSPLIGLGHGAEYKSVYSSLMKDFGAQLSYIHNGYLFVWLKYGVLGLVAVAILVFTVMRLGVQAYRASPTDHPRLWQAQAVTITLLVYLPLAMLMPLWAEFGYLMSLACLLIVLSSATQALRGRPPRAPQAS